MAEPPASDERLHGLRARWERDRSSRVFLQLAEEHRRRGQVREAAAVLEEGLASHPGYLSARVALGRSRLELGESAAAREVLAGVLAQDPTHLLACKLLVQACVELEDAAGAMEALDRYRLLGAPAGEVEELERWLATVRTGPQAATARAAQRAGLPVTEARELPRDLATPLQAAPSPPADEAAEGSASALDTGERAVAAADDDPFHLQARRRSSLRLPPPPARVAADDRGFHGASQAPPILLAPTGERRERLRIGLTAGEVFGTGSPARAEVAATGEASVTEASVTTVAEPVPTVPEAPSADTSPLAPPAGDLATGERLEPVPAEAAEEERLPEEPMSGEAVASPAPWVEEEVAAPAAPARPVATPTGATATLGDLYLRQGYLGEAARIFREVLAHDPGNEQAARGLAAAEGRRGRDLAAVELLGEEGARERGVTARKMLVLKRYLEVLREGAARHVPRTPS